MECNIDIVSLALSRYCYFMKLDKLNFVCIRDYSLNRLHVSDYLLYDSLNCISNDLKVFRRSSKLDPVVHNLDHSLMLLLKIPNELLVLK